MDTKKPAKARRFRELEVARAIRAVDRADQVVDAVHIDREGCVTLEISHAPQPAAVVR